MGPLFSRFRRKRSTVEQLEDIDKEITRLQRNRKINQDRQKQLVNSLLVYSLAAYVIAAIIFFCISFPETWQLRLLYSLPLWIFPAVVWVIKRSLHWYFVQRISSNDLALEELTDRKNQILEDVMETETYKKAREILERFDPARLRNLEGVPDVVTPDVPRTSRPAEVGTAGTSIQQRTLATTQQFPARTQAVALSAPDITSEHNGAPHLSSSHLQDMLPVAPGLAGEFALVPRPPMPRSVLPRDRGVMDKLMDYLVGDGPENRYALICQRCYSHNGMALREEFEYLSFRCCYCYWMNPARKRRPTAPRLEFFAPAGLKSCSNEQDTTSEEDDCGDFEHEDGKQDDHKGDEQRCSQSGPSPVLSPSIPSGQCVLQSVPEVSSFSPLQEPPHMHTGQEEPPHLHTGQGEPPHLHTGQGEPLHLHTGQGEPPDLHAGQGEPPHLHTGEHAPINLHTGEHAPMEIHPREYNSGEIHPGEHDTVEIHPGEHAPVDLHQGDYEPVEIHPREYNSVEIHPWDDEPIEIYPGEHEPVEIDTGEHDTIEIHPGEHEPVEIHLGEHEPVETYPGEHEPAEIHPGEHEPVETYPGEHEPVENHPGEHDTVEIPPGEDEPVENHPGEHDTIENHPGEHDTVEIHPGEHDTVEIHPGEPEPVEIHPGEHYTVEILPGEHELVEIHSGEHDTVDE